MAYLNGNEILFTAGAAGIVNIDDTPTENSTNPVSSGGVYNAVSGIDKWETIDDTTLEESVGYYLKRFGKKYRKIQIRMEITADTTDFAKAGRLNGLAYQGDDTTYIFQDQGDWLPRDGMTKIVLINIGMKGKYCCSEVLNYSAGSVDMASRYLALAGSVWHRDSTMGVALSDDSLDGIKITFINNEYPIPAGTRIIVMGVESNEML